MNRTWRIMGLLVAAALGWWSAAGLDYVAGKAIQKQAAAEPEDWPIEVAVDSTNLSTSPDM
jgi:hypothetical protein